MPVELSRLESGIYLIELSALVSIDEMIYAQGQGLSQTLDHGDEAHVLLIEIASDIQMPFDIREARALIDNDQSLAVLTIAPSLRVRFIAMILGRLFGVGHVEHFSSRDKAVERARALLSVT